MRTRLTKVGAAVAAIAALAVGGATLASAQQGGSEPAQAPAGAEPESQQGQEFESEGAEAQALQSKAAISAAEARSAALAAVPGTVGETELDNENGNIVYSVEIKKDDGSQIDVKVDAGNGKVVSQEAENSNEANEAEEPGD